MYSQEQETAIVRGVSYIIDEMNNVPPEDFAYFFVKYDPKVAEELMNQLNFALFDKNLKEKD